MITYKTVAVVSLPFNLHFCQLHFHIIVDEPLTKSMLLDETGRRIKKFTRFVAVCCSLVFN